jgi:hypothetical protein
MSDLISRAALLEAWKIQLLNEGIMFQHDVVDLITNAPAIEQGELEAQLAIAVEALEEIARDSNSNLWQPYTASEALNKIRMQNKSAESNGG